MRISARRPFGIAISVLIEGAEPRGPQPDGLHRPHELLDLDEVVLPRGRVRAEREGAEEMFYRLLRRDNWRGWRGCWLT